MSSKARFTAVGADETWTLLVRAFIRQGALFTRATLRSTVRPRTIILSPDIGAKFFNRRRCRRKRERPPGQGCAGRCHESVRPRPGCPEVTSDVAGARRPASAHC